MLKDELEPLLTLRNLTHLKIFCCFEGNLRDGQLMRMVTAWPCLQKLELQPYWSGDISVTPKGMVFIVEHCQKLRELTVPFRFNPPEGSGDAICNHNLTTLDVRYSVVNDPAATAAFLANILPNLQEIRSWDKDGQSTVLVFQEQWDEVLGLVKDLKRVHEQESAMSHP